MRVVSRVTERRPAGPPLPSRRASRPALELFLWSRAAIWLAALFAFAWFEPNRHPRADVWDTPRLHDLGYGIDIWARWDSDFFLRIAEHGYDATSAAFFPLYPLLVGGLGRVFLGHYVLAGVVVSLAACLASFLLLFRIAEPHLGGDGARRAVLYLAVFPMSLFLQAVYSESLFLALSLGAFLAAERRRFGWAGVAAGLALLTRSAGLALLPALALLAWRAPQRGRAFAGLALAPALFATFPLYLWWKLGDAWAFLHAQDLWHRSVSPWGPLAGLYDGVLAGVHGIPRMFAPHPGGINPLHHAAEDIVHLVFLLVFLPLAVLAWRRFGAVYGLYAAASLALPLSYPSSRFALLSLPRFGLVVFPLFLALAAVGGRPRAHTAIVAISALFLGVTVTQWALWQWVS